MSLNCLPEIVILVAFSPVCALALFDMPNSNRFDILSISIFSEISLSISIFSKISLSISIFSKISLSISIFSRTALSISIFSRIAVSISIFSRIALSISISIFSRIALSISISIFLEWPYRYRYIDCRYKYSIFHPQIRGKNTKIG